MWLVHVSIVVFGLLTLGERGSTQAEQQTCLYAPGYRATPERGLFSGPRVDNPPESPSGLLQCPNDLCTIIGDNRTDFATGLRGTFDIDLSLLTYYENKRTARTGGSVIGSVLQQEGFFHDWNYRVCSNWKIFYEGANLSPSTGQSCQTTIGGWSNIKKRFYKKVYGLSGEYRCMEVVSLAHTPPPGLKPTSSQGGCTGNGNVVGIQQYFLVPSQGGKVKARVSGLNPEFNYIIPIPYATYQTLEGWQSVARPITQPPFVKVTNDKGIVVFEWDHSKTGYQLSKAFWAVEIDVINVTQTAFIDIESYDYQSFVPIRAIKMWEKADTQLIVQVVESRLGIGLESDSWTQEEACKEVGDWCVWYPIGDYLGTYDENQGSDRARQVFRGKVGQGDFCNGVSYPSGCPWECKGMKTCKTFRGKGGFTITSGSLNSSFSSFQGNFPVWSLQYPGGEVESKDLEESGKMIGEDWNRLGSQWKTGSGYLRQRELIDGFLQAGFSRGAAEGVWCKRINCKNCTSMFDRETGNLRLEPLIRSDVDLPIATKPPVTVSKGVDKVSLALGLGGSALMICFLALILGSIAVAEAKRRINGGGGPLERNNMGFVDDLA